MPLSLIFDISHAIGYSIDYAKSYAIDCTIGYIIGFVIGYLIDYPGFFNIDVAVNLSLMTLLLAMSMEIDMALFCGFLRTLSITIVLT